MKRSLNLVPTAVRRRLALRRIVRVWSTTMVVSGLCVGALLGLEWTRGMVTTRQLSELNARYAPYEQILREQDELTVNIEQLRAREQLSLRLSRESHGLATLGVVAEAARETGSDVYIEELVLSESAVTTPDDTSPSGTLRLEGASVDSGAVAGFAERLRASGLFSTVAIESTAPLPGGDNTLRSFVVACTL